MAAPRRTSASSSAPKGAPLDSAPAKAPVGQIALAGGLTVVGIGFAIYLFTSKKTAPEPPKAQEPPVIEAEALPPAPEPVVKKSDSGTYLKELPPDVRKDVVGRLDALSMQIDPLERRELEVDKIEDPEKRREEYDLLRDEYAGIADGIIEVLEDPKYKTYTDDEAYGHNFASYRNRLKYYQSKLVSLRSKSNAAFNAIKNEDPKDG